MAASTTEISNMSLSHLGIGTEIADLETEDSEEAKACRRFYQISLDTVLRDFDWGFATKKVQAALVETFDPDDSCEFAYSYRYPANAVKLRRILSGARVDTDQSRIPFRESFDASGKLVLTDAGPLTYIALDGVWFEITANDIAPEHYPSDFTLALSYMLSAMIAPRLSKEDAYGLGAKALQRYYLMLSTASKNDAKESAPDQEYDSEFIRVRG